ncbi:MAG: hypothetical protein U5K77_01375 [Candidatus Saccharibacteria bacterium]|nr:hypothetical protein [Candidatus Saccharibacteria bacterium]
MSSHRSIVARLHKWHKTPQGLTIFAVMEFALAYVFSSWAIDSGSYWHYIPAVILLLGGIQNTARLIGVYIKYGSK